MTNGSDLPGIQQLENALARGDMLGIRGALLELASDERDALEARLGSDAVAKLFENTRRAVRSGARGKVVVIHGIMGGRLDVVSGSDTDRIWLNYFRLAMGRIADLRLPVDGEAAPGKLRVQVGGMLPEYLPTITELGTQWDVLPFAYDWRDDLDKAADDLARRIEEWRGGQPVHLVAHSMGGLVSRWFIRKHRDLWKAMQDPSGMKRGGRLVMLGTPNRGSLTIPLVLSGEGKTVKLLAKCDLKHNMPELLDILGTFLGCYQMLPSPRLQFGDDRMKLWEKKAWGTLPVRVSNLGRAKKFHEDLHEVLDAERLVYVAGYDRTTPYRIRVDAPGKFSYQETQDGDGRVPHELGLLDGVHTLWVNETHGDLQRNAAVLDGIHELLATGDTSSLEHARPATRAVRVAPVWRPAQAIDTVPEEVLATIAKPISRGVKGAARGVTPIGRGAKRAAAGVTPIDRGAERAAAGVNPEAAARIEAELASGFVGAGSETRTIVGSPKQLGGVATTHGGDAGRTKQGGDAGRTKQGGGVAPSMQGGSGAATKKGGGGAWIKHGGSGAATKHGASGAPTKQGGVPPSDPRWGSRTAPPGRRLSLNVEVVWGDITKVVGDVYVCGHYVNVLPQAAEAALDRVVSPPDADQSRRVLTNLTRRGVLRGALGDVYFYPWADRRFRHRMVAIAGMGHPGTFGGAELRSLARNLTLAVTSLPDAATVCTVLIGGGVGNLSVPSAVEGLIAGMASALPLLDPGVSIGTLKIVEFHLPKAIEIHRLLIERLVNEYADKVPLKVSPEVTIGEITLDDEASLVSALTAAATASKSAPHSAEGRALATLLGTLPRANSSRVQALNALKKFAPARNGDVREFAGKVAVSLVRKKKDEFPAPTRISFVSGDQGISAAAIADTAVIPVRNESLDEKLIEETINDMTDPPTDRVGRLSRLLARFVLPRDFRELLKKESPFVFEVDRKTARIQWEMIARSVDTDEEKPLSLVHPVARQLRTTYSPPPAPWVTTGP